MRMKIITISKAEQLTSFWQRLGGTREWPIVYVVTKWFSEYRGD